MGFMGVGFAAVGLHLAEALHHGRHGFIECRGA